MAFKPGYGGQHGTLRCLHQRAKVKPSEETQPGEATHPVVPPQPMGTGNREHGVGILLPGTKPPTLQVSLRGRVCPERSKGLPARLRGLGPRACRLPGAGSCPVHTLSCRRPERKGGSSPGWPGGGCLCVAFRATCPLSFPTFPTQFSPLAPLPSGSHQPGCPEALPPAPAHKGRSVWS